MNRRRRVIPLLAALTLLEVALVRTTGTVAAQARTLGSLGDPLTDPVAGLLAVLAVVAELLAAYLLLVVAMWLAARLPGAPGLLAARGVRLIALPPLGRLLDGLLGGVLLAQIVLAPAAARAQPAAPPDHPPTAEAMLAAGTVAAVATPEPGSTPPEHPSTAAASALAGGASVAADAGDRLLPGAGQGSGSREEIPSTSSTVPSPPWVPLPTWLGGSQPSGTSATTATTTVPRRPSPSSPEGEGREAERGGDAGAPGTEVGRPYVIRPGDTLWDVAAAHLPRGGRSAARIDRYWRWIHAANRGVLGDDPHLIHPGTRLVLPPAEPSVRPHRP